MKKGFTFTLVEILIVFIVLGILTAIAIPNYHKWKMKEKAKKDIISLYSLLQSLREKAFTTKQSYTININNNTIQVNNTTYSFYCSFNATQSSFKITSRGTFSTGTTIKCNKCYEFNLPYNCIVITNYNLRISKCN